MQMRRRSLPAPCHNARWVYSRVGSLGGDDPSERRPHGCRHGSGPSWSSSSPLHPGRRDLIGPAAAAARMRNASVPGDRGGEVRQVQGRELACFVMTLTLPGVRPLRGGGPGSPTGPKTRSPGGEDSRLSRRHGATLPLSLLGDRPTAFLGRARSHPSTLSAPACAPSPQPLLLFRDAAPPSPGAPVRSRHGCPARRAGVPLRPAR